MRKTTLNAIVDTIAFFPLLVTAVTGIIIWLYLPRGTQLAAFGTVLSHQTFLGIQRQIWLDVHTYLGLLFTALVAIHLVLHWSYIKHLPQRLARTETKKDHSVKRFLALLLIGVVIVAVVIIAVYASNTAPSSSEPNYVIWVDYQHNDEPYCIFSAESKCSGQSFVYSDKHQRPRLYLLSQPQRSFHVYSVPPEHVRVTGRSLQLSRFAFSIFFLVLMSRLSIFQR